MKKTMTAFSVMVALGAGLTLAPFAHAGLLPDFLSGSPEKASKSHKETSEKMRLEASEKAKKKARVASQQVYLTRKLIAKTNRERRTRISPPDYSKSTPAKGKKK